MGTSASNSGPKGNPPLLPPWYNDNNPPNSDEEGDVPIDQQPQDPNTLEEPAENDQQEQPDLVPTISRDWGKAKGALTRRANNTGGGSTRKAGSNYLKSLGGVNGAIKAAAQGIKVGRAFADFLEVVSTEGLERALRGIGLQEFIGRPFEEVCAAIANAISPPGTTNDESVAREALISTLDSLYARTQDTDDRSEFLLDTDQVAEIIIEFVSNFVFTKWMYELGVAIEKGSITEAEAIELELEVRELILEDTKAHYREIDVASFNLDQQTNRLTIEEIFRTAYSTLDL